MKLSNKLNLPDSVYQAIANDGYTKGNSHFSVTELLKPSRQWALLQNHGDEIVEDVSDRIWALYGKMGHKLFEDSSSKNELVETRFFVDILGYKVSGQIDNLELKSGILSDYKFTSSWGFMANRPPKEEWIAQLNMQRYLLELHKYPIRRLQIIGLLRDWQINEANKNPDYPQTPITVMPIPFWTMDQTESFMEERVESHVRALQELPKCADKDLWIRKGKYTRCENYCSVSKFCDQFKHTKGDQ